MRNNTTYNNRQPLWKQKLLRAREQWYLKHHTAARDFGVPLPVYSDKDTNSLTRCICAWLKYKEHYANRINSQGQVRLERVELANGGHYKKANWTRGNTNPGTADITAVIYGKHIAIEVKCKRTKDRMRPDQLKEKQRIEAAGGIYHVATDMESFIEWYEQTFEDSRNGFELFEQPEQSKTC
ncbi:MAG TPA: hypothetical protein VFW07_01395 [Parafilimonas sp.]|nr:hypothetical protein [Parafilimonas sp.]